MADGDATTVQPWVELRPYQVDALRAISAAWRDGHHRTVLVLPTGCGKTVTFTEVMRRRRAAGRGRALVIAHRTELITQARDTIVRGGLAAEIEMADQRASLHGDLYGSSDVVIASVQTLRGRRLEKWRRDAFATIVIDEAHHAVAAGYQAILEHFAPAGSETRVLGVTATPDRGDKVALGHVLPHLAFEYPLRQAIAEKALVPIKLMQIDTPAIDLSTVKVTRQEHGRDLDARAIAEQMTAERALHEVAAPLMRERGNRPTIVFTPSVEVAHELARVCNGYLGRDGCRALDGTASSDERADVIRGFREGRVEVLINCALFTEGFDAPLASCVAVARPTQSRSLYAQMIGRGTRPSPATGKEDLLVLDFAPANARHSLASPIDLMAGEDLPDDERKALVERTQRGEDVLQILEQSEAEKREREAKRAKYRASGNLTVEAKYSRRARDPFDVFAALDVEVSEADKRGPRATERQAEVLERMGVKEARTMSRKEAGKLLDVMGQRRKDGLCTLRQMHSIRRAGLRTDLTFKEASEVMDALVSNGWRVTPEIAERYGR